MQTLFKSQPSVRKEVVEVAHVCIWEASEHVLEVLKSIDLQPLASLNKGHEDCGSMSTFDRAGKEPVGTAKDNRFDRAFACIVRDVDVAGISEEAECIPSIEGVRNCIGEFGFRRFFESVFVKPGFEKSKFWISQPLTQVLALQLSEVFGNTLNIKETFEHAHGKFDSYLVVEPGVLEAAMDMGPAIGRSSTGSNYPVKFICTVGKKNTLEAFENFFWVHGVLSFGEIVYGVGKGAIAKHGPDDAAVSLAETFLNDGQSGGIGQNQTTLQEESFHSGDDGFEEVGASIEPAAHGGSIDGQTERFENLFLAVEGQVKEEFVGNDFSQQSRSNLSFINWLEGLVGSEDVLAAFFATVFVDDMFDFFKDGLYKVDLRSNVKAEESPYVAAARAGERVWIGDSMLFLAVFDRGRGSSGASAAFIYSFDDIEISLFVFKFFNCLRMDGFTGAGKERGIDLSGLFTEGGAVVSGELFFESGDTSEEFTNEVMAISEIVRQFVGAGRIGVRSLFRHFFVFGFDVTILYSMHREWYQREIVRLLLWAEGIELSG